jgi:hypothetical protein
MRSDAVNCLPRLAEAEGTHWIVGELRRYAAVTFSDAFFAVGGISISIRTRSAYKGLGECES